VDAADAPATDAAPAADDHVPPSDGADTPSEEVLELMASLGLVLVPNTQTTPLPREGSANTGATLDAKAQAAPTTLLQAAELQNSTKVEANKTEDTTPAAAPLIAAEGAKDHTAPVAETPSAAVLASESHASQPTLQPQPQAAQAPLPTAAQLTAVQPQFQSGADGSFQQSGGHDEGHLRSAVKAEAIDEAAPAQAGPMPEHMAAAGISAPTLATEAPVDPQAANVASQIAQQVDFYKLPGNKGVRIQLHPDDLGGVQVTLRYAPGGNLELHINVEHASTGSLVEAGWSQLRDALATQGFQPDRLVMSVTGPASANQMDFSSSNGNGSYRQDPGLAAFTQDGKSGHQRNGAEDPRGPRGWNSAAEPVGGVDDSPRNASSVGAAASRIDYRV
jgi:flagellar hook-length control protein FliK